LGRVKALLLELAKNNPLLSISRTVPTLNGDHDDGMGKQASSTIS